MNDRQVMLSVRTHLNQMSWEKEEKKCVQRIKNRKTTTIPRETKWEGCKHLVRSPSSWHFFMKLKRKAITNNNNNFEYTTQTHIHSMATAPNPWENISAQNQQQPHHHTLECFSLLLFLLHLKRQQQQQHYKTHCKLSQWRLKTHPIQSDDDGGGGDDNDDDDKTKSADLSNNNSGKQKLVPKCSMSGTIHISVLKRMLIKQKRSKQLNTIALQRGEKKLSEALEHTHTHIFNRFQTVYQIEHRQQCSQEFGLAFTFSAASRKNNIEK